MPNACTHAVRTCASLLVRKFSSSSQNKVAEIRFDGGLSIGETAELLNVSPGTVRRDWTMTRTWLHHKLKPDTR